MHIGLAGWSIHRRFRRKDNPLQLLDFPRLARHEWGFGAVELNNVFMASHDDDYVDRLKRNAEECGVALWGMAVDGAGSLCGENEDERRASIAKCAEYLPIGKRLGLTYMRFNTGGDDNPSEAQIERCADSFAQLAKMGEEQGIMICIENHGGLSKTPDPMVAVMKRVNSSYCRTLPDFGNFAPEIRYEALEKVVPFAVACHAKFFEFDEHGNDTQIDAGRIRNIFKAASFDGRLALEFEGQMDDGEGVRLSKALLERTFV